MTNMELVHLVARAYDTGFLKGIDDCGKDAENFEFSLEYLAERDDWIRAQVTEGTTA